MDLIPFDSEEELLESSNANISAFGVLSEGNCTRPSRLTSLMTINFHSTESVPVLQGFSPVMLNFAALCCILFMCVGIPGNLITIFALARCKKVREERRGMLTN
jgi:hypothetical protein